jgi:hypothetical protein
MFGAAEGNLLDIATRETKCICRHSTTRRQAHPLRRLNTRKPKKSQTYMKRCKYNRNQANPARVAPCERMWQRTADREATQSHASESPVPGEHKDV